MAKTKSTAATVLAYKDTEMAAIEALKAAGKPVSAAELGVSSGTLTSIRNKAKKVAEGKLEVPADMTCYDIETVDDEYMKPSTKTVHVYSYIKDFVPASDKEKLGENSLAVLAFLKDQLNPVFLKDIPNGNAGSVNALVKKGLVSSEERVVDCEVKATRKLYSLR